MKIGIAYDTQEMYDFAFSFASEDRKLVKDIKDKITSMNYTVFYDYDIQYDLLGKDLYSYLRKVYLCKCKFVVCFISKYYVDKIWTNLEFTAIKERLMSTFFASDFLIPILIDDSDKLDDIPSFIGFYKYKTTDKTVTLLKNKYENYLVEENYIYNVNSCINYICEKIAGELCIRKYNVTHKGNTIEVIYNNRHNHVFSFTTENKMNIPCILIYHNEKRSPEIFISWENHDILEFQVNYFYAIKGAKDNISITELIEEIIRYILEYVG